MNKLQWFLLLYLLFTSLILTAQNPSPGQAYKLIAGNSMVLSKNYYLLTLLQENKDVKKLLETDKQLTAFTKAKSDNLISSLKECSKEAACFTGRMKFSEQEIKDIGDRLAELYNTNNALSTLVLKDLIPSGTYILFHALSPQQLLVKAWEQDAHGINFTISVYAEGKKANYPLIDSISFNVSNPRYAGFIYNTAYLITEENKSSNLFFSLPLQAALHFLEINERDNAGEYEPMASTVNKPAYDKVNSVKWNDYKYSVILVPGAGAEYLVKALSAEGMIRCRLAAIQYKNGLSPFIVVSGGRVHPYKTKYSEEGLPQS